jgi:hypothetical protein
VRHVVDGYLRAANVKRPQVSNHALRHTSATPAPRSPIATRTTYARCRTCLATRIRTLLPVMRAWSIARRAIRRSKCRCSHP